MPSVVYGSFDHIPDLVDSLVECFLSILAGVCQVSSSVCRILNPRNLCLRCDARVVCDRINQFLTVMSGLILAMVRKYKIFRLLDR